MVSHVFFYKFLSILCVQDLEREGSRGGPNGDVDDPSAPLNPGNQGTVKKSTSVKDDKGGVGKCKGGIRCRVLLLDGNDCFIVVPVSKGLIPSASYSLELEEMN